MKDNTLLEIYVRVDELFATTQTKKKIAKNLLAPVEIS